MTYNEAIKTMNWKIPIYESRYSEKVLCFESTGFGMSETGGKKHINFHKMVVYLVYI